MRVWRDKSGAKAARAGSYGIDGGSVVVPVSALALTALGGGAVWALRRGRYLPGSLAAIGGCAVAGFAASYLYSSTRGKFSVWAETLDELGLRGDERILDIGCGRGAVLLLAAQWLPAGRAVGVDVWRRRDQTGNTRAAAERNAVLEGVRDRVEFVNADARGLPFPDGSFDLVVSSLAIHNIPGDGGRDQGLREAVRVLRPGGRLRIIDQRLSGYPDPVLLEVEGCTNVNVRRLDWRMWFGTPGDPLVLVTATKAAPH